MAFARYAHDGVVFVARVYVAKCLVVFAEWVGAVSVLGTRSHGGRRRFWEWTAEKKEKMKEIRDFTVLHDDARYTASPAQLRW